MKSFLKIEKHSDFPMENIPFGVFLNQDEPHICTAIGEFVVDLNILESFGYFKDCSFADEKPFSEAVLNKFMSLGKEARVEARKKIQELFLENSPISGGKGFLDKILFPLEKATMLLPVAIGDYTDFYSSREHATNVGIMFRGKENALMPNWLHLPVAYHGRASSIVVSGTDLIRPSGQIKNDDNPAPEFSKTKQLDFELEMGFFIGTGNELGKPVKSENAFEHIFGMVLVNDWSARDIQKWEYVPLGPFLSKNFATTISPWIITLEALEPFKVEGPKQEPEPMDYLKTQGNPTYDINLEVYIKSGKMSEPYLISKSNFKYLYWNMAQQLAHHTITGCNTRPGDMMASGTISGPEKENRGSMLELTWRGTEPIKLPDGSERKFFNDGDEVIIKGYCEKDGLRIGFGESKGLILPDGQ